LHQRQLLQQSGRAIFWFLAYLKKRSRPGVCLHCTVHVPFLLPKGELPSCWPPAASTFVFCAQRQVPFPYARNEARHVLENIFSSNYRGREELDSVHFLWKPFFLVTSGIRRNYTWFNPRGQPFSWYLERSGGSTLGPVISSNSDGTLQVTGGISFNPALSATTWLCTVLIIFITNLDEMWTVQYVFKLPTTPDPTSVMH
jgi:hypothetical protein